MVDTTPNKEIIRRITMLHGATYCYILVKTGLNHIEVHTNISTEKITSCEAELRDWAGMYFKVFNNLSDTENIDKIKKNGEKILPIMT